MEGKNMNIPPAGEKTQEELDKMWKDREMRRDAFEKKYKPVVEQMLSEYDDVVKDDQHLSSDVGCSKEFIAAHRWHTFDGSLGKVKIELNDKK